MQSSGSKKVTDTPPQSEPAETDLGKQSYLGTKRSDASETPKSDHQTVFTTDQTSGALQTDQPNANLQNLLAGIEKGVRDNPLMKNLPDIILQLYLQGNDNNANQIITQLIQGLYTEKQDIQSEITHVLTKISRKLDSEGLVPATTRLSRKLTKWINRETSLTPNYEKFSFELQAIATSLIEKEQFQKSKHILETYSHNHSGKTERNENIQLFSGKIIENIASDNIVNLLMQKPPTDDEKTHDLMIECMSLLMPASVEKMLDRLRDVQDMSERVRIMKVLSEIDTVPSEILTSRIIKGGPWYYIRNLVKLLGQFGGEDTIAPLQTLLSHDHVRVKQETLNTIYLIGGGKREEIFINALETADDDLKINIVAFLGALQSEKAVDPLIQILESRKFITSKAKSELEEKVCAALGKIGSPFAIPVLKSITGKKGLLRFFNEKVKASAANALEAIHKHQEELEKTGTKLKKTKQAPKTKPRQEENQEENPEDKKINRLVEENKTKEAVKLLYHLIVKYARKKDFKRAEALSEKLYEVDSMALDEIIKSAEIIEEEKKKGINKSFMELWSDLYNLLSPEEANALYYSLKSKSFEADQKIMKQGKIDGNLYFINQGQVKIIYQASDKETLLHTLESGGLTGQETFFSISVCTTSLIALTKVTLDYLNNSILSEWKEKFPGLEQKLHDYCSQFANTHDLIKQKGMDRRKYKRVNVSGKVISQIFNNSGKPLGKTFRGDLVDISSGGISFLMKVSRPENARILLGRNLKMTLALNGKKIQKKITRPGKVIGVHQRQFSDYSIHIQFKKLLDEKIIATAEEISEIKPG